MLCTTCSNYSGYYSIKKNSNKMNNNILYHSIDIAILNEQYVILGSQIVVQAHKSWVMNPTSPIQ